MKLLLRSLARRDDGIAATEFGLILVPLMVLLMGGLDLAHQAYIRSVLQGALSDAARKAAVEDPGFVASGDTLEERIENTISGQVDSVAPDASYKIEIENFYDFSGIGNPEKLVTDVDGNGQYDEGDGDCFEDLNDNGSFDLDSGRGGVGGANDVVFYQAQVTLPRLLPVAGLIGMGDTMELNAEAAVRNQPYDAQASVPTVCGEPD